MNAKTPPIPTLTDAQSREHWVESMLRAVPRSREDVEATYDTWMVEHDARVRQAVLQEVPSMDQCVTALNAVSVPLGGRRGRHQGQRTHLGAVAGTRPVERLTAH